MNFKDNACVPIAMFVYNRPEHTKKTIKALVDNVLSGDTELFVFSDGARNEAEIKLVNEVREYLYTVKGFKSVNIIQRQNNYGLANNIIDGVTRLVNLYGSVIVVEDDIVTGKWFLSYMNDALKRYKNIEKVMAVSSYLPPIDKHGLSEAFFSPCFECWGWGTWKRSWDMFDKNLDKIITDTPDSLIYRINVDGTTNKWNQVLNNYNKKLDTWAIFFYYAIMKNDGLVLNTSLDMVQNIGCDGTGENCGYVRRNIQVVLSDQKIEKFPDKLGIDELIWDKLKDYYKKTKKNAFQRFCIVLMNEGVIGVGKRLRYRFKRRNGGG